jgi:hypothetical protein
LDAYEVLAGLTPTQRALVADRLRTLEAPYIQAASLKAKELQQAHTPIKGKVDEVGVQRAYDYLQRASNLTEDGNLKLRLDLLSETISDYYMQQAKKCFAKPLGSGVGLGWIYLNQAQLFKPDREEVRDERTKSSAIYQMRSNLSVRVVFRDQTSRRVSAGFAEQLSDAIANGLETSGLPVKVLRPNDPSSVEPNFQLIGDVLQHRTTMTQNVESLESKYRVGIRELPNEDWNNTNRQYEAAMLNLQNAHKSLDALQTHGKKKEIADATSYVVDAEKKAEDVRRKLDSIPKTVPSDIIKPYTYSKKTIDLAAVVELLFRLVDASGVPVDPPVPISKTAKESVTILENVKPEDTQGVRAQGSLPDELQFLTDVEIEAKDALIKLAREKVEGLPAKTLEQARRKQKDGDVDGAAEAYILYLNSTPDKASAEREEAKKFLQDQFNVRQVLSSNL